LFKKNVFLNDLHPVIVKNDGGVEFREGTRERGIQGASSLFKDYKQKPGNPFHFPPKKPSFERDSQGTGGLVGVRNHLAMRGEKGGVGFTWVVRESF